MELAVVGATGLVGEALLDLLPGFGLPVSKIHALASAAAVGRRVSWGERHLGVGDLAEFDFGRASHAIFAVPRAVAASHVPRATAAGCTVVDVSTAWSANVPEPVFDIAAAAGSLAGLGRGSVVSLPGPLAAVAAEALSPLRQASRFQSVGIVGFRAASDRGRAGMAALARETADLLNARPRQATPFAQQLAFNLIPGSGSADADGVLPEELAVASQVQRLLGTEHVPVDVTLIEAPLFFGAAAVVRVALEDPLPVAAARELLAGAPGVVLADPDGEGLYPSPVGHSAGEGGLAIARLRALPAGNGLVFWVLADNVRHGVARNALRVLAALVAGGR